MQSRGFRDLGLHRQYVGFLVLSAFFALYASLTDADLGYPLDLL